MANPIQTLHSLGQSLWYDNIQRRMLENGELAALIEQGELRGMTSNPSIFNQAIAKSNDYDAALTALAWSGYSAEQILDQLVMEDIRAAADLFLPLYQSSGGSDGFVSIEVNPDLARDTEGTLAEARRLWKSINRPNLMVKIPATQEGLPAIRAATAEGINVNITLIFSITRYLEVMDAYLSGLEDRLNAGQPVERVASVASFFVSRIDSKVDKQLEELVRKEGPLAERAVQLFGKLAVANARLAYARFREVFEGERFARLKEHGAQLQRPLWASTSTKNPNYPDTKYVDELIGRNTVNTVPPQTLDAFRERGTARLTIEEDLGAAERAFEELESLGISMAEVTQQLEVEGVKAFADAFQDLLKTVASRREAAMRQLGPLAEGVAARVEALGKAEAAHKLWSAEPNLWTDDPAGQAEFRNRLGWLDLPVKAQQWIPEIESFARQVITDGFTHSLLLGMGGSSLAPEVMRQVFHPGEASSEPAGQQNTWLDLSIVDSTDPGQVLTASQRVPAEQTLYIVSSKSGTTAEVNALLAYFWEKAYQKLGDQTGRSFIAITDPGTPLEALAQQRSFRQVFLGEPAVGGRYSALSPFGLVPAALLGVELERLLERAAWMSSQTTPEIPAGRNPALVLGAVIGEAALRGRDKLTLIADPSVAPFGAWLEQLLAESSGKEGRGIVPVDGEPVAGPEQYGPDRLFVYLRMDGTFASHADQLLAAGQPVLVFPFQDPYDLGAEFFRWEYATAIACAVLRVNPFDQPDVQDNKRRTLLKIESYLQTGRLEEGEPDWQGEGVRVYGNLPSGDSSTLAAVLESFLAQARPGDYVALNAYVPRIGEIENQLARLRQALRKRTLLATTVGFGPRFLHSTGQLHKGGGNNGLFLQITADPEEDLDIPSERMTFATLEHAQALGDFDSLVGHGRRALRVHLNHPAEVEKLVEALTSRRAEL